MIDREARGNLIQVIEAYLDDQLMAFDFDEQITKLAGTTNDETVRIVVQQLWYFYDDCTNHRVVLSKEAWNYVQRLLLLLDSDAELREERRWHWTWKQTLALAALLVFLAITIKVGFGEHLHIVAIPFGIFSMILSAIEALMQDEDSDSERIARLTPFNNLSEILNVHRRCHSFRKRRYRLDLADRLIRSRASDLINNFQCWIQWLLWSPFVLFAQSFPRRENRVQLHLADASHSRFTL